MYSILLFKYIYRKNNLLNDDYHFDYHINSKIKINLSNPNIKKTNQNKNENNISNSTTYSIY